MILLDTCALLWLVHDPTKLSKAATHAIRAHVASLHVSSVSAWEIAIKVAAGKLTLPPGLTAETWFSQVLNACGLTEICPDAGIFCRAVALPVIHRDPCDRLIIATAVAHRLTVVTADNVIPQYPNCTVIW
jgi:PIN domain nuclease of toxin-antitoxin system